MTGIHWKRVALAGFLSELGVVVALSMIILTYRFLIARGRTAAEYQEFGQRAGYYVAAPVAAIATFLIASWAVHGLQAYFVTNGLMVGVIATLLSVGFIFGANRKDRMMYVASFILRIASGYFAGFVAQHLKG